MRQDIVLVHRVLTSASVIAILGAVASPASAQTAPPTAAPAPSQPQPTGDQTASSQLDDIVVTAQKREESVSRAPVAVTAISQEKLQAAGVVEVSDLPSVAPSVQVTTYPLLNNIQMSIRGIASRGLGDPLNPAVATYQDGVYVPATNGLGGALYDLARIEVLRGPQGILYGRNATAGSINIITADPQPDFHAAADISAGNYGDVLARGMVNVPLSDTLSVRGAFVFHRNDGVYDTQGTTARDLGAADDRGFRLTALWKPTSNFKWRVAVDDYIGDDTQTQGIITAPNGKPAGNASVLSGPIRSQPEPKFHLTNFSIRSRMDLQLGDMLSVSYIAGYQRNRFDFATQFQASPTPFAGALGWVKTIGTYHEVNLNFDTGRVRNIFGATYAYSHLTDIVDDPIYAFSLNIAPYQNEKATSWGVFDQLTFRMTDTFRLVGGVRYSRDRKSFVETDSYCAVDYLLSTGADPSQCAAPAGTFDQSATYSRVNWKAGMEYDVSPSGLAYLSVTTGYKAGGFNASAPTVPSFRPEDVTNYELGFKTRLLDNRASVNIALFYQDYRNIQVTQQTIFPFTANAAAAKIYGAEIEGSWKITSDDQLDVFATAMHAAYRNYLNGVDGQTGTIVPSLNGNRLPNAPDYSLRVQYAHDFHLPSGAKITPSGSFYWQSKSYLREFNLPVDRVPAYSKSILRLTYQDPSARWRVEGFVNNVENKVVKIGYQTIFGFYNTYYGEPRTYGARVSFTY